MFDRIMKSLKLKSLDTLAIIFTVILFSLAHYGLVVRDFAVEHKELAVHLNEIVYQQNGCTDTVFLMGHDASILTRDGIKYYINHEGLSKCEKTDAFIHHPHLQKQTYDITVDDTDNITTTIHFPYHIVYEFDDGTTIDLDISQDLNLEPITLGLFLILTTVLLLIFRMSMKRSDDQIDNLRISAQEYVLAERTILYLVNIMHHKLNSPIKVITTKSRVLMERIAESNSDPKIIETSEENYAALHKAIDSILEMTSKLKTYNQLSQHETDIYNICVIAKETIDILKDEEFTVSIDYKTKLFDIDVDHIRSHEIIQIFINQIKFSLVQQLADNISFKIFRDTDDSITVLYTDNGNPLEQCVLDMIKNRIDVSELLKRDKVEEDYVDLILNFNILNANKQSNIRLLTSNANGNVFTIRLPTVRKQLKK